MNQQFNLVYLVRVLLKWKWAIIAVAIVSGIIAVVVSLTLPEYYKSSAVIYPVNQGITDRSMLFSTGGEVRVDYYGTKQDASRILQIAHSAELMGFMVNHFNLAQHYEVDTNSKYWRTKVNREFQDNYTVIKTEQEAIEITIEDTDPEMAAAMVMTLLEKIDEHNKAPVIKNKQRIANTFAESVDAKQTQVNELTDSLNALGKKYSIAVKINEEGKRLITGPTAEGVELYNILSSRHQTALEELNELTTLKEQYELSASENVPSITIVEQAYPADRRFKPVRSLICITTVLIATFLASIAVLLIEQAKLIKRQIAEEDAQQAI